MKLSASKIEDLTEFLEFNGNSIGNIQNSNELEDELLCFERENNQIEVMRDNIKQMNQNADDFMQNLEFEKLLSF